MCYTPCLVDASALITTHDYKIDNWASYWSCHCRKIGGDASWQLYVWVYGTVICTTASGVGSSKEIIDNGGGEGGEMTISGGI